ncbi:hypothetical protein [Costertonia aggregata]|uniref:Uncharacterized protein n=1 Tax=Costertonia aggregata TaxID=343403 RepID=A0A7H9ARH6_9FLAO|nr:hypothetical protein [Costertonia aggregata]QLG46044.1 hypothetical protein HYG79_12045 [Costertonia aggregata]
MQINKKTKPIRDKETGRWLGSEKGITPEEFLQAFEDYKVWAKQNPKIKQVPNTKTHSVINLEMEIPLTKTGFVLYLRREGITGSGSDILCNRDGRFEEFVEVNQYIDDSTFDDQFTGGMVGVFNHSLTARKLGLSDRQEVKTQGKIEIDFNDAD